MRAWLAAAIVTLSLAPAFAQAPSKPADVAGPWKMTLDMAMGIASPRFVVVQDGEKLSGIYTSGRYGDVPLTGTIKDRSLTFTVTIVPEGQPLTMVFTGDVAATGLTMKGRADLGALGDGTWTAAREPVAATAPSPPS